MEGTVFLREIRAVSSFSKFYDRLYLQDSTALTTDQKVSLNLTLVKLRNMVLQKMKQLKV